MAIPKTAREAPETGETHGTRTAARIRRDFLDFFLARPSGSGTAPGTAPGTTSGTAAGPGAGPGSDPGAPPGAQPGAGHTFVPSSPVVPHDDPTLLFTNAGMNQFKDVFLGQGSRPYKRAVNSQKCIRAGGKHNDLEDVGKDTYHHTFFEMLGNWSFGDYFKREAIQWAWELLTEVWGLEKDRLYVTVFAGDEDDGLDPDEDAARLWAEVTDIDPAHISRWGRKDNFWEMGESGPCGPCSEIHYDDTPDKTGGDLVNAGDPNVIEIWNLVFIQFNRDQSGRLTPLPARHVDTGMGFERIVRVLQGKRSNYDTDIWTPIFAAIRERTGAREHQGVLDDPVDIAYRVIADHIRCLTVAITDGATPGNEGRGYVLRRILRRAVRHARQTMGTDKPVLCDLVPAVVDSLGDAFPELKKSPQRVADVILAEEKAFLKTIDRGIELFEAACGAARDRTISADDAFKLHDTYGFPIDLTQVMAEERGMTVEVAGFERLMEEARAKSRAGVEKDESFTLTPDAIEKLKRLGAKPTDDHARFDARPVMAKVEAIWNGRDFDENAHINRLVAVILDRTNHYAEAGGQVGDVGTIARDDEVGFGRAHSEEPASFHVAETQKVGDYILHIGRITAGVLRIGDRVAVTVDRGHREPVRANHTATHLLNFALREVIGDEVDQKGSLVAPDRLRFDFSSAAAMKRAQIEQAERLVAAMIEQDLPVHAEEIPLATAQSITGVRAVFGENYPDPVRVVSIGVPGRALKNDPADPKWRQFSIEFCGGTHVKSTAAVQRFIITQEQALAAGVRRVTALTGEAARAAREAGEAMLVRISRVRSLQREDLLREFDAIAADAEHITTGALLRQRIQQELDELREQVKAVRKESQASAREKIVEQARSIAERTKGEVIVAEIDGAEKDTLLVALDVIRAKAPGSAAMLLTADRDESKVFIAASVPKELIARGLKAGDWVREAAKACGGGGGGRPDMAQAGGKQPEQVAHVMQIARDFADARLA